ncbi:hypothetical protein M0802_015869 [Mischocyttarus mexicanus]|nr:hypothetical protein M0802_015869 [Mischocyttarus mexicanus]
MANLILLVLSIAATTEAFIGFDCGNGPINVSAISLINVGDCHHQQRQINSTGVYMQLLQATEYTSIPILQCKVVISRMVQYCGMHSHTSAVHNDFAEYLMEPTARQCRNMHDTGTLYLTSSTQLFDLKVNTTTTRAVTLAGTIANNGSCSGTQYSDSYGSWSRVVVQATVKVTLASSYVPVKVSTGKIALRSGTVCQLGEGQCLDMECGYTFWDVVPVNAGFDFSSCEVLYEGWAQKMRDLNDHDAPEVYSLTTKDVTFALTCTTETRLCGFVIFRTKHPKLFINFFANSKLKHE